VKGLHVIIGNLTYEIDFMIVEAKLRIPHHPNMSTLSMLSPLSQ
jgi:hypothetical protein